MSLSSTHNNLDKFKRIMNQVYGEFSSTRSWAPKLYPEYANSGGGGRYLWTDAFGVCNYITLFCETKDPKYLDQADSLINQVHEILGKGRHGDNKRLEPATDEQPLLGGLRIGKIDDEGSDGDGQYFHYLTKWMFCLNRMSIARNDEKYNQWAIDLAKSIHPAFVYKPSNSNRSRMFWKMSIDLKKPLVRSEGNLDPFDGYLTYRILQDTDLHFNQGSSASSADDSSANRGILDKEIADMKSMVDVKYPYYSSNDPLDLGEAMWIAHWYYDEPWSHHISKESLHSINELWDQGYFKSHSYYRLAFREFGTTIGVQVNPLVERQKKEWIDRRVPMLHSFWEKELFKRDSNITPVMYCTSLIPGAFKRDYVENHMKQLSES